MDLPGHTRDIIDVADGIDRVMGDRRLYARMLVRFKRDYAGGASAILAALERGDSREAHRLSHSLKGAAGMIGAVALQRAASVAEQALRTGVAHIHPYLTVLDAEFDKVYRMLDILVDHLATSDDTPRTLLNNPALIAQLTDLLLHGDGAAVDLVAASADSLNAILGAAVFAALSAAVTGFDYPRALQILRDATRSG